MLRPDFNPQDLDGVNLPALDRALSKAAYTQSGTGGPAALDGWVARSVTIPIPVVGKGKSGQLPTDVPVEGLYLRNMLGGIRKGFMANIVQQFIYEPYQSCYVPPGAPLSEPQRIMDEIYTSPTMLKAHKEIQQLDISDTGCTLPRVVAAVMLGSDALQLGNFSTKKAWVLYMWLGNLSNFVDHDIFMRYLGGGIGHFNQCPPSESINNSANSVDIDGEGDELDISERYDIETDPNANGDEPWDEDDSNKDSNGSENDDESDDGFIRDLYDF